ncbi:lysostaphin resistance A-like protein [Enterobacter huaxiensis]|uniref:CPBP family intramembrane glutamic endopeptidase n=1 Tax=Enterobacter huaxiensis TaxID=2494702 RepID=UPI002175DB99|nr:type II CAAX endopeptidase family protein [Enterobacter huaxiensis]MCS5452279.1 CPBP family intramembrane metalloprotease [Enterobacter huaxiensis]
MNESLEQRIISKITASLFLLFFILSVMITIIPVYTIHSLGADASVIIMMGIEFILALSIYFFSFRKLVGFNSRKFSGNTVGLAFACLFAIQLFLHFTSSRLSVPRPSIISVLILTIIIPFYEEVFYRGCLFGFLNHISNGYVTSSIVTSIVFSLMHTQYSSPEEYVGMFLISITLIHVRIKTNGLIYPMALHSATNTLALSLMKYNV